MPVLLLSCLLLLAACNSGELTSPAGPSGGPDSRTGGAGGSDDACSPTLTSLTEDVFAGTCTASGCHGSTKPAASLDLTSPDLLAHVVGQDSTCDGWPLIAPGNAEGSLLLRKLTGTAPEGCGDAMPPSGPMLASAQVECVRGFIDSLDADAGTPPDGCETCGTSSCIDLTVDGQHCGDCDTVCPAGASCAEGKCECPDGLTACGDRCVDVSRDLSHCGACDAPCGAGALCSAGKCECGGGLEACAAGCAELATDPSNCGSCDNECGPGKLCTPTGCGTQADCGGLTVCSGACVDTSASLVHCGGCDMRCDPGQACDNGTCVCPNGGTSCLGSCVDTNADALNCGTCGKVCPQGTTCEQGECTCAGGGAVCGTACVDLTTDEANCGTCGNACVPGQACESGGCACPDRVVSYQDDVAPILANNCTNAGCHTGVKAKEGLDLNLSKSYAEVVSIEAAQCNDGRLLVKSGDPGNSYLLQKILGVEMCSGSQMPKAGVTLPADELEALVAWICQGAKP